MNKVGVGTLIKDAVIGEGTQVWHYCNLYGCHIGRNCVIGSHVEIGEGVTIGDNCKIEAYTFIPPGVTIGDNVFVGPRVTFTNDKHPHAQGNWQITETVIGDGVSIGAASTILCGVTVEEGAASAGSVQFMTANHPSTYEDGEIYTLSAFIKSDDDMQFHLLISGGSEDGFQPSFRSETFITTDVWTEYYVTTDPFPFQPLATRAKFFVGYGDGAFWIDDIRIYMDEYVPTSPAENIAVAMTADKLAATWASIKSSD